MVTINLPRRFKKSVTDQRKDEQRFTSHKLRIMNERKEAYGHYRTCI